MNNINNNFRSQRVVKKDSTVGGFPVLQPTHYSRHNGTHHLLPLIENNDKNNMKDHTVTNNANANNQIIAWGWKIEWAAIPSLPVYYVLEPTSLTITNVSLDLIQGRIFNFLRLHSICHTYLAENARLDCCTLDMLKFSVQFWRVSFGQDDNDGGAVTLELQRRQGSVIEMQRIRRAMFTVVTTGEEPKDSELLWKPKKPPLPDTIMAEADEEYNHNQGRADAIRICLELLESPAYDQVQLGLESLRMLVDASIVSRQDAVVVASEVLFQETETGHRFRAALMRCFRQAEATMQQDGAFDYEEGVHSLGLVILANALELVVAEDKNNAIDHESAIDPASAFWQTVNRNLLCGLQRAIEKPNEGAISAKCIRLLHALSTDSAGAHFNPTVGIQSCLTEAHQYGRRCHLSLERESLRLLAMLSH